MIRVDKNFRRTHGRNEILCEENFHFKHFCNETKSRLNINEPLRNMKPLTTVRQKHLLGSLFAPEGNFFW